MINPASPDLHFIASYKASEALCELLSVLPETDLVIEISNIAEIQLQMLGCILEHKHFGDEAIKTFIIYADEMKWQARRLGE
jgi:hypothetical protein